MRQNNITPQINNFGPEIHTSSTTRSHFNEMVPLHIILEIRVIDWMQLIQDDESVVEANSITWSYTFWLFS